MRTPRGLHRAKPPKAFKAPPEVCELLMALGKISMVESGTVLFSKGDPTEVVYLVLSGRVALSAGDDPTRITRIAESGSLLGLPATIRDKPYSLTAEAVTECEVCAVPPATLRDAVATNPAVGMAVVAILGNEISILQRLAVYTK